MPKENHQKAADHHEQAAKAYGAATGQHGSSDHAGAKQPSAKAADKSKAAHEHAAQANKGAKTLDVLFHDTLKDIYFAEKLILKTLPKLAKAAHSGALKAAFEKHYGETQGHVDRLEQVFALIDKKPQAKTCEAIVGITDEGAEIMDEYKGSQALDAGLLAAAQAVEHYEISRYGTLRTWANELGFTKAAALFEKTLEEEEATDHALTKIAEAVVNQEAQHAAE
jgi:ferritin-like metal-binding protein YciE